MSTDCPSDQALLAFHLGTLPAAEVDGVAEHLETCGRCEGAVQRLDGEADPVLAVLRKPLSTAGRGAGQLPPDDWPDLPGYEVFGPLGKGGMGVVYKALQVRLNRLVALKRLRSGSPRELARARTEAVALARLQHPNIVQVFEVAEHRGSAYLVLELVEGGPLGGKLQGKPRPPRATAALLEPVARAVHYAHQRGVVHRDLKPANVLMSADGTPKINDFGVAKQLDGDAGETREGDVIGTPAYMAPEQAGGKPGEVGPAADVYALGVVLYEMLTGRVPLQGPTTLDTLVLVRTEEPVPPRRLQPGIPRDLETVCLKCLQKEPKRRYGDAAELADDLGRFLAHEPVRARPTPAWERAWKWAKRRPVVAALSAAVVLVAAVGFVLVAWQWRRADAKAKDEAEAKQTAQERALEVERLSARMTLDQGINLCESGDVGRGLLWMAQALEVAERTGDGDLALAARRNLAGMLPFFVRQPAQLPHKSLVVDVALSPDGRAALTASLDGTAGLWDAATGKPRGGPLRHSYPVGAVAFSPDGKLALTGGGDDKRHAGEARLWDAATGKPVARQPPAFPAEVERVAFSPDGKTFLTLCSEEVRLWRTEDCAPAAPPLRHPAVAKPDRRVQPKLVAAFSPDGKQVATGGEDGAVRLWDAATGKAHGTPLKTAGPVLALAFRPEGCELATGSFDGTTQVWDVASGAARGPALRHGGRVKAVAYSNDGAVLATGGAVEALDVESGVPRITGGEARLWKAATGKALGAPLPHPLPVWALAFTPGGRLLLTGCEDGAARVFQTANGAPLGRPLGHEGTVTALAVSRDGAVALTASAGGDGFAAARLWELPPESAFGRPLLQPGKILALAFSPDGRTLAAGADDRTARLWDVAAGRQVGTLSHGPYDNRRPHWPDENAILFVAFGPDGRSVLTGSEDGDLRGWDRATGRQRLHVRLPEQICSAALSPDGRAVLVGFLSHKAQLWGMAEGAPLGPVIPAPGPVWASAFSPDGRALLTGGGGAACLWDRDTGRAVGRWPGAGVQWATFCPGGTQALVVSDHFAHVWDIRTGQGLGQPLYHPEGGVNRLAPSPDGQSVLISSTDATARLWDVATGTTLGPPASREAVGAVAFAPDGRRFAVAGRDGRIVLWEVPQPLAGSPEAVRLRVEALTGLELGPQKAVRELSADAVRLRRERLAELEAALK
ncbi:MAG TPA: protein kinase [Gemmataceae bacterium]|nr:protein kinase [Gemmataceae bacterium]